MGEAWEQLYRLADTNIGRSGTTMMLASVYVQLSGYIPLPPLSVQVLQLAKEPQTLLATLHALQLLSDTGGRTRISTVTRCYVIL